MKYPFALQLYSVRDYFERNPADALARVKAAGYDHVELAGTCGMTAAAFMGLVRDAGLNPVSMHVGIEAVTGSPEGVLADARTFGVEYVVVPWLGPEQCPDRDAWLAAARAMDAAGARLRGGGITLCYHNHDHEFATLGDGTIFDLIFGSSDPENLQAELDTCWSTVGGADTTALIRRFTGRLPLVHVKDFTPGERGGAVFAELGRGIMDWNAVLPAARAAGARWFVVEQDASATDTMESAAVNAAFMARFNEENP